MTDDEKIDAKQKALIRDYKRVFDSDAGRRVYKDIMKECYMDEQTHDVENVNLTFVLNGMRTVGLNIKKFVDYDFRKKKKKSVKQEAKEPVET